MVLKRGIDYIGVGVGAIIVADDGRLLFAQRGEQAKNERGCWEFPGGSVEFGETLTAALQREMGEEFGISIQVDSLLDIVDHILPDERQHWVSPTYICHIRKGIPAILEPEKCAALGWFLPENPPTPLSIITRENLAHYRNYISTSQS